MACICSEVDDVNIVNIRADGKVKCRQGWVSGCCDLGSLNVTSVGSWYRCK